MQIPTGRIMKAPDFATSQDEATNCVRIARSAFEAVPKMDRAEFILAQPGWRLSRSVSGTVQNHIGTKLAVEFIDLGPQQVKNITQPIRAYRIRARSRRSPPWLWVLLFRFPTSSQCGASVCENEQRSGSGIFCGPEWSRRSPAIPPVCRSTPKSQSFQRGLLRVGCAVMVRLVPAIVLLKCQV